MIRHNVHVAGQGGATTLEFVCLDGDSIHILDAGGGPSVVIPAQWLSARTQALDAQPHALRDGSLVLTVRSMPAVPVEP